MATMNVSLPQEMKDWVESRTEGGQYANASDYVRDLIRRDRIREEKIANWRNLVEEAESAGIDERSGEDVLAAIQARVLARHPKAS